MNNLKDVAIQAALNGADILEKYAGTLDADDVETKNKFDFVTKVDKESEQIIVDTILKNFPDHKIYAEESHRDEQGEYRWIIDPLDGTTNYIHNVPVYCVSIGVEHNGELILGVVYDPNRKELFFAEKGRGAFLNEKPIHVSSIRDTDRALIATGYPFRVKHLIDVYQESFKELFLHISGVRRAGSAAIDLCYIACGRYDGFWELDFQPWDLAAAHIILTQAGGRITDFGGGDQVMHTGNTIASNTHLHPFLTDTVKKVFKGIVDK